MTDNHDTPPRPKRVAEPVQVYLNPEEKARLNRLAAHLDTSKSHVLRQGLEALERQLTDPGAHPALQIIGLAGEEAAPPTDGDVAREHDRFLADSEITSWTGHQAPDDA